MDDPVGLNAMNEGESLTTGFSRKIWQKLIIIKAPRAWLKRPDLPPTRKLSCEKARRGAINCVYLHPRIWYIAEKSTGEGA